MKLQLSIIGILLLLAIPQQALGDETVICESAGDRYTECRVRNIRDKEVYLERQLSKSSCREGYSWGIARRGIWVDKGCRARFSVSYDRDYDRRDYDRDYDSDYRRRHHRDRDYDRRERDEIRRERDEYRRELEQERRRRAIERQNTNRRNNENIIRPKCPAGTKFTGRTCKITDPSLKKPGGDGNINPCPKGMWLSGDRCVPD